MAWHRPCASSKPCMLHVQPARCSEEVNYVFLEPDRPIDCPMAAVGNNLRVLSAPHASFWSKESLRRWLPVLLDRVVPALPACPLRAANACPFVSQRWIAFWPALVAGRILSDRTSVVCLRVSFPESPTENQRQDRAGFSSPGHRQWPSRRAPVERHVPHAVSGPALVVTALPHHRVCPLALCAPVSLSFSVARRQSRVCGAGGIPWTPVWMGSGRHGGDPLDVHVAYPD